MTAGYAFRRLRVFGIDEVQALQLALVGIRADLRRIGATAVWLDRPAFGDYAQLAALAYGAGQTRKGDLAAERAVELAPKDRREEIKSALEAQKTQAATSAAQGAAGSTPATPSTTPGS